MSCLMFDDEAVAGLMPDEPVYPTSGSGTAITNTTTADPFVLTQKSIVRLVVPANQLGGLAVVKRDKTDFVNVMWTDQNHTNQIVLSVILDKGSQIIKHPQSGSGVLVQYTTLE